MKILEKVLDRMLTTPEEAKALAKRSATSQPVQSATAAEKSARLGRGSTAAATTHPATVYLLLDVSGSMDEGKLRQAKDGALSFAKDAIGKGYEVGVIQFSSWARVRTKPTRNLAAIRAGVSGVGLQATTNMAAAIKLAARQLGEARGLRAMVLVTDGYPDSAAYALAVAENAKRSDITIIAIGTEDADREFLKKIASATELATTVPDAKLEVTIAKAAGLLPARTSRS